MTRGFWAQPMFQVSSQGLSDRAFDCHRSGEVSLPKEDTAARGGMNFALYRDATCIPSKVNKKSGSRHIVRLPISHPSGLHEKMIVTTLRYRRRRGASDAVH